MTTNLCERDDVGPINPPPPFYAGLEPVVAATLEQAPAPDDIVG